MPGFQTLKKLAFTCTIKANENREIRQFDLGERLNGEVRGRSLDTHECLLVTAWIR